MGQATPAVEELRAIAEEAYLYGFPMIVGYKVMRDYFIDRTSGPFKAPIGFSRRTHLSLQPGQRWRGLGPAASPFTGPGLPTDTGVTGRARRG
jgi:hypothetical protein